MYIYGKTCISAVSGVEEQSGSLLGISLHKDVSYPVGKVNEIDVYPMNFSEFMIAKGEEEMYKLLASRDFDVALQRTGAVDEYSIILLTLLMRVK